MLEDLRGLANNAVNRSRVDGEYPKLLRGFVCYMMIQHQLNSGNICPISRSDLNQELKFYIDNITDPDVQAVFRSPHFNIDRDFLLEAGDAYFGATSQAQQIRQQMNATVPVAAPPAAASARIAAGE